LTFLGPCLSRETSDSENLQRSQAIPLNDCFLDANTSGGSISQRTEEETPTDCFLALNLVGIETPRTLLEEMKADYLLVEKRAIVGQVTSKSNHTSKEKKTDSESFDHTKFLTKHGPALTGLKEAIYRINHTLISVQMGPGGRDGPSTGKRVISKEKLKVYQRNK